MFPEINHYLRILVTKACNMRCSYCHGEGSAEHGELPIEQLKTYIDAAVALGYGKIKFAGGEPFLRRDFIDLIAYARSLSSDLDLSVISAGAVPAEKVDAAFAAGLSRINLSVHGFTPVCFSANGGPREYHLRQQFIARVLEHGKPLKVNYVFTRSGQREDVRQLIEALRGHRVTINLLDDIFDNSTSGEDIIALITDLAGAPESIYRKEKVGMATLIYRYPDGLDFEIKSDRLGDLAPLRACSSCPQRSACKEGIFSLRIDADGSFSPCIYRQELRYQPRLPALNDPLALQGLWQHYLQEILV